MSGPTSPHLRWRDDSGAAVVDFTLTSGLVALMFVAVLQLGVALHIRSTLVSCAAEGARYGARMESTPEQGAERTRDLITRSLPDRYAEGVEAGTAVTDDGVQVVVVTVDAPVPVLGPLGPDGSLSVTGRAFSEEQ